jgi:hypothetical protein
MATSLRSALIALWLLSPVMSACASSTVTTTDSIAAKTPATGEPNASDSAQAPKVQNVHADYAISVDTLEDLVTYGDAFVTFAVDKIEPIPLSKEDAERSEGVLISSKLTVQIEEIHWARPGAKSIPSSVAFPWLTSVRTDGRDLPAVTNDGQILEAGERYVGLFFREDSDQEGDQWQPLASETMAAIGANGEIAFPNYAPPSLIQASIDGKSADEVGGLLSRTPQHAGFDAGEDLTLLERYCRVVEAGGPKGVLGLDACQVADTATTLSSPTG